ncbi:MAG: YlxR family protein [Actinomycetota bacterium]
MAGSARRDCGADMAGSYRGPVRTCVGCRTRRPKDALLRVAVAPNGDVAIEARRARGTGRGAYICKNPSCAERAVASGALSRALKRKELDLSELRIELRRLIGVDEDNG